MRTRLPEDQAGLCCYCAASIAGGAFHIEHFKPRSSFERLTYSWRNLLASCQGVGRAAAGGEIVPTQRHCGDAKDDWFEQGVTVDPQVTNVERFFRYPLDGRIAAGKTLTPAKFAQVDETIRRLNLNAPSLVARRRAILGLAAEQAGQLTRADWVERFLAPRPDGTLQEFWPALSYQYVRLWAQEAEPRLLQ